MDYQALCQGVITLSKETGQFILNERQKFTNEYIEEKSTNQFVSYVDKEAEKMIVAQLEYLLPEAGFITEEGTSTKKGDTFHWIVDPLDGTTNYIHGIPCFAVSIALMEKNKMVIGVVYEINQDECFYAWKDGPAFLNDDKITVSNTKKLADSLLATGFPFDVFDGMDEYIECLRLLMKNSRGLRRIGSAATDLAYVACGRFDGFFETHLNPWDVAAGGFIIERAGGKITDYAGGDNYAFGKGIVAANTKIHQQMYETLEKTHKN